MNADSGERIAEVAPAVPTAAGDGVFDYRVPPALVDQVLPGTRVIIPLSGRRVEGYCLRLKSTSDIPPERLRDILSAADDAPAYPPSFLELAAWIADRYLCRPGEVLRTAMPGKGRFKDRTAVRLAVPAAEAAAALEGLPAAARVQAAILRELVGGPGGAVAVPVRVELPILRRRAGPGYRSGLSALVEKGLIEMAEGPATTVRRARKASPDAPPAEDEGGPDSRPALVPLVLTPEQEGALAAVRIGLGQPAPHDQISGRLSRVFLLHGVTAGGKTEVYLRAAGETLALGRQVLVLVPEVSLVPQTLDRVRSHLGPARVAVAHSYLGDRERLENWRRIARDEVDVVVGARSAVLAPLRRLGLIILDEEHEDAYKQEQGCPRYHAREVAVQRAAAEGAVVILASATPSLETYHRAQRGEYVLLPLSERVGGLGLPPVEIVDMREELKAGNRSVFSRSLQRRLGEVLAEGRQAILFLNRRGHSTFVLCRDCGWVARCPNCDLSLVYHDPRADLLCHCCGHHAPPPETCPACGGHRVRYFGAGTQRIEQEVRALFPSARVARLDTDTAGQSGELARVLALFTSGQADILVGTQMVAKGLDIPGVGLVAAVSADSALHLPDFRAAEKTFRLLTQAGGRAGRKDSRGKVIIQTYNPGHPAVSAAATHDYAGFAAAELESRRLLGYPPYRHLIRVEFVDTSEAEVSAAALAFSGHLESEGVPRAADPASGVAGSRQIGPSEAPIRRVRGRFRWHVLVFCESPAEGLAAVKKAVRLTTGHDARGGREGRSSVSVMVDVDPVSVL